MRFLGDATFDKAVSNYVLMDIRDYEGALIEVARVLKPGGTFVVVISHPAFASVGFRINDFEEPRVPERGRRELPAK